ncbi:hypothetical protein BSKO_07726 [Bryopsis sp. KO-2023]|nr:hypothetical protein BSKO_07726 [Bryopsis sp. KO-2023]
MGLELMMSTLEVQPDLLLLQDPPRSVVQGVIPSGYKVLLPAGQDSLVAVVFRDGLCVRILEAVSSRVVAAQITLSTHKKVNLISAYIQHTSGEGLAELRTCTSFCSTDESIPVIVATDSNSQSSWWGPIRPVLSTVSQRFLDYVISSEFFVANIFPGPPTWQSPTGGQHWIDVTLSSRADVVHDWQAHPIDLSVSDHAPISFRLVGAPPQQTYIPRRMWARADWEHIYSDLRRDLDAWNLEHTTLGRDHMALDRQVDQFIGIVRNSIQHHVPWGRISTKSKKWWSADLSLKRRALKRAARKLAVFRRKYPSLPADTLQGTVREAREAYNLAVETAKTTFWRTEVMTADSNTIWTLYKKQQPSETPVQLTNITDMSGRVHTGDAQIAGALADKFFPPTGQGADHQHFVAQVAGISPPPLSDFDPITLKELHINLSQCKAFGAPGEDGIPFSFWKKVFDVVGHSILRLFNCCLRHGYHPVRWRRALVVPIPKKPGHNNDVSKLRPISLLNTSSKWFERILGARLAKFAETQGLWSDNQFGFRKHRSTNLALSKMGAFLKGGKQTVLGVSLDISGAFDNVSRSKLLARLHEDGYPSYLYHWTASFTLHRTGVITLPSAAYFEFLLGDGTPQGSPVSPLLFLVYIDELLRLAGDIFVVGYADDLFIAFRGPFNTGWQNIQQDSRFHNKRESKCWEYISIGTLPFANIWIRCRPSSILVVI